MTLARKQTLVAFRNDPFHAAMRVRGLDLSAATFGFAVRLYPDQPGAPILTIGNVTLPNTTGIRVVDSGVDEAIPFTDIEIIIGKGDNYPPAGEAGADTILAYDFQWTPTPPLSGFFDPEQTILFGDFIVKGSVNA